MHITYPSHLIWYKNVLEDPLAYFGKSKSARLRSTIKRLQDTAVTHTFAPLSPEFLDWFEPLYANAMRAKQNPLAHNIRALTLERDSKYAYHTLALYEQGVPIGGVIFSLRDRSLSIAYRTYEPSWHTANLQANPALYAEYLTGIYALENEKERLSHGKDRNPYGPNAALGLAIFKLSVGCSAHIPKINYTAQELETDEITEDTLVFACPTDGRDVTDAYLITSPDTMAAHLQATKYPKRLKVTVIERK